MLLRTQNVFSIVVAYSCKTVMRIKGIKISLWLQCLLVIGFSGRRITDQV